MSIFNQKLIDKINKDLSDSVSIDSIIEYLEIETRKSPKESTIDLTSLDQNKPNVIPWNNLGIQLIKEKRYYESEKVWLKLISIAYDLAQSRYGNVPPIGLPLNNLALVYQHQGKSNDAFVAVLEAYQFDIRTGNPGMVARNNFHMMLKELLSRYNIENIDILNIIGSSTKKQTDKEIKLKIPFKGQSIMAWLIFLIPTLFGSFMLYKYPNKWFFLFILLTGIAAGASLFFKIVKIKTSFGSIEFINPITSKDEYSIL